MKPLEQRAAAYLAKLPPAIQGQQGHNRLFQAACVCVEFGLTPERAALALADWNQTHSQPPFSENELRHKLADAFKRTSPKGHFAPLQSPCPTHKRRSNPILEHRILTAPVKTTKTAAAEAIDALAGKLHEGSKAELNALARLRGISVAAVALASARRLLRFGEYRGQRAWFILDGSCRVIQARRLDGQHWTASAKAWTLAGSQAAWPVGIREAQNFYAIALCEGSADLLAMLHFLECEGRADDCAPVAMLGGCARIHADALPIFAGKRVRIFRHSDPTGEDAADRWAEQLTEAGATVDAFRFDGLRRVDGQPVNDLNNLAAIHADDFEAHRNLWTLFDYAANIRNG